VTAPVFKTGERRVCPLLVGSTPTRFRHSGSLDFARDFRLRAPASLTPAGRLKFDSHSLPPFESVEALLAFGLGFAEDERRHDSLTVAIFITAEFAENAKR